MVSQVEYAILSRHVYRDATAPALPAGWETIPVELPLGSADTGFYAEA